MLVAWTAEELAALPALKAKAARERLRPAARSSAPAEVYRQLPDLGPGALGGLTVPGRIDHLHLDHHARAGHRRPPARRPTCCLEHAVRSVGRRRRSTPPCTATTAATSAPGGSSTPPDWAATAIDQMFGYDRFTVTPRRGELLVFDKQARPLVNKIVLPVPTSRGKGVLISPTIYGNVMLGPTAETCTTARPPAPREAGFDFLLGKGRTLMPRLLQRGGHRQLRRPARGHRPRRLPDRGRP